MLTFGRKQYKDFFAHSRHENERIFHKIKVLDLIYKSLHRSFFIIFIRKFYIVFKNQNTQLFIEITFSICKCLLTKVNEYEWL